MGERSSRASGGWDIGPGDLRALADNARWALGIARSTSSRLMLGVTLLVLGRGLFPAGLALVARGAVNTTVAALDGASLVPLYLWLAGGFLLTVGEGLAGHAVKLLGQRLRDELDYRVTSDILEHVAKLDVAQFEDPAFQDVLERARRGPADHVARFVTEILAGAGAAIQLASLFALLAYIEPIILLLAPLGLPFLLHQYRLSSRQYGLEHSRATQRRWGSYFVSLLTGRDSVSEVKILGLAPLLLERFRALMAKHHREDRGHYMRALRSGSLFVLISTAAIYAVFLRVAFLAVQGKLTLGDLAVFGGAAGRLRATLEALVLSLSTAVERMLYIANVRELLATRPRVANDGAPLAAEDVRGAIALEDVTFAYPGTSAPALKDVSLRIAPGETVALVGENGAGKTTLAKLIARFFDPTEGAVRLDGTDLRDLSIESLHAQIAFVFQGFGRYEASAGDNIAFGDWRNLLTDPERVREIGRTAGVDPLIAALPDGYDTDLGRVFGKVDLSGGEWQQLAMARAFAREARLLILDEPTSNLDARAEYELFERFRELAHGRTTIIISHRFSTVRMADRIHVLDEGTIVESGSHEELVELGGSYAKLYELQSRALGTSEG